MIPAVLKIANIIMHPCRSNNSIASGKTFKNANNIKYATNPTIDMPTLRICKKEKNSNFIQYAKFQLNQMSERTFGGKFSTLHIVARGVMPAAAIKMTKDSDSTGTHLNDDRSQPIKYK